MENECTLPLCQLSVLSLLALWLLPCILLLSTLHRGAHLFSLLGHPGVHAHFLLLMVLLQDHMASLAVTANSHHVPWLSYCQHFSCLLAQTLPTLNLFIVLAFLAITSSASAKVVLFISIVGASEMLTEVREWFLSPEPFNLHLLAFVHFLTSAENVYRVHHLLIQFYFWQTYFGFFSSQNSALTKQLGYMFVCQFFVVAVTSSNDTLSAWV